MITFTDDLHLVGGGQMGLTAATDCHIWALRGPGGLVIVDAGGGLATEAVAANIRALGRPVAGLLLTHYHFDHACGAPELARLLDCPVLMSEVAAEIIATQDRAASGLELAIGKGMYPPETPWETYQADRAIADGEMVEVGGLRFECMLIPAHSEDSMVYLTTVGGRRLIFTGDLLQWGGLIGLINWRGSTLEGYRKHLPRLAGLGVDIFAPGHGIPVLANGQRHIDLAIAALERSFVPWCIGQVGY